MTARRTPKTFAEARARLDEILEDLEREPDDVDQLAARIQEASGLLRFCRERLSAARLEVQEVVAGLTAAGAEAETAAGRQADVDEQEPAPRGRRTTGAQARSDHGDESDPDDGAGAAGARGELPF